MIPEPDGTAELEALLERLIDGKFDASDRTRLNVLLTQGEAPRRYYRGYMRLHHGLEWRIGKPALRQELCPPRDWNGDEGQDKRERGMVGLPAIDLPVGAAVEHPVGAAVELPHHLDLESQIPNPPFPALSTTHYPLPTSDFVGSWAFSCMVATVFVGVMLLGFWAITITHHYEIADNSRGQTAPGVSAHTEPEMVFVGRITGMAD
ncbi:MAG: hypothetical protein KKE86_14615, partial [Planctomycetes bacterium]|nr:hypothetical protein [Planctomycetota bacterium]